MAFSCDPVFFGIAAARSLCSFPGRLLVVLPRSFTLGVRAGYPFFFLYWVSSGPYFVWTAQLVICPPIGVVDIHSLRIAITEQAATDLVSLRTSSRASTVDEIFYSSGYFSLVALWPQVVIFRYQWFSRQLICDYCYDYR